jgi:hypothetical protein
MRINTYIYADYHTLIPPRPLRLRRPFSNKPARGWLHMILNLHDRGKQMKQLTVHLDAAAILALIFLASVGMNVWQFLDSKELMQKYVDAKWELGNSKANMVHARRQLKACDPNKYADLDVNP